MYTKSFPLIWRTRKWTLSCSQMRCSSEIMQATCQEKIASLSRESWLRSLCVIVIIPIDPIWYFSWGLSGLLCTMMNATKRLAPHTVHHPHDLYIDQHRSSNPHPFLSPESKKNRWRGKGGAEKVHRFCSGSLLAQKVVVSVTVQFAQFSSPFLSNDNDRPDRHIIQGLFRWVQMVWVCAWLDTSSNVLIISYDS